MTKKHLINIVSQNNSAGLAIDVEVINTALDGGEFKTLWLKRNSPPLSWLRARRLGIHQLILPNIKINIFLENIWSQWISFADINIFVPNQEWIRDEDIYLLKRMDAVLCKTVIATKTFENHHRNVYFCGFTSPDGFKDKIAATQPLTALHIAGRNPYKGTQALLELWKKHPNWPNLTIVQRAIGDGTVAHQEHSLHTNIKYIAGFLKDAEKNKLQQQSTIHIAPSSVEGFGHSIVEAMSVGAIVITTNAPPMNEMVNKECGFLVEAKIGSPVGLGNHYHIFPESLEMQIQKAILLSDEERAKIGFNAREWYRMNTKIFAFQLQEILTKLIDEFDNRRRHTILSRIKRILN